MSLLSVGTALRPVKERCGATEGQEKAQSLTRRPYVLSAQNLARQGCRKRELLSPSTHWPGPSTLGHSIHTPTLRRRGYYPIFQKAKPDLGLVQQAAGRQSWGPHLCVLGPSRAFSVTSCYPLLFSPTDVRVWGCCRMGSFRFSHLPG